MYLSIKQHDSFRTLLMGFEVPFRSYVAEKITTAFRTPVDFENAMIAKSNLPSFSALPWFVRKTLPKEIRNSTLQDMYRRFADASSVVSEIVDSDKDLPFVSALNLATFTLTECFSELFACCRSYGDYCSLAEKYYYARNKLSHPLCRTLEDEHLVPVLSFVKDICVFLDDKHFIAKTRDDILAEVTALQHRKITIPIASHNLRDIPYSDSRIVLRDDEIQMIKDFVYGKEDAIRKQHSLCIYGYGGIGKTALVVEAIKQIVQDVLDGITINEYVPEYLFYFSAKKRKLDVAAETGKIIEQNVRCNFESAAELISLIKESLSCDNFRGFKKEGLIVVDNLETLSESDRQEVQDFIDTKTPSEMQFILTSRNSESYNVNFKLAGFNESGIAFIEKYIEENSLDISLSEDEMRELLSLSEGNTLVLVLCLRRLSQNLVPVSSLKADFSSRNAWKSIKTGLAQSRPAYEVISEFMYKDTFEYIEEAFSDSIDIFYKVLKVFAIIPDSGTDLTTVCLLSEEPLSQVEVVIDALCSYLILEKDGVQYRLNSFAEKYIVNRFIPDAVTYASLSQKVAARQRQVRNDLAKLQEDMAARPDLADIINDWLIISDADRITAAKMYKMFQEVKRTLNYGNKFNINSQLQEFVTACEEAESLTAHPFVKFQKARILFEIEKSKLVAGDWPTEIMAAYRDCIFSINTIDQYSGIMQTKSYASLLWLYGYYLQQHNEYLESIRLLEEAKRAFENMSIKTKEYDQCAVLLGTTYLDYYEQDRGSRVAYLREARTVVRQLDDRKRNKEDFEKKAYSHYMALKDRIGKYGKY